MTYESSATHPQGDWLSWAKTPGFHPGKLAAVLAGFAIFPPLGVAAIGYFLWTSRRGDWRGAPVNAMRRGGCGHRHRGTGNQAFDAHRESVLNGLEAERQAFDAHRAEERRKRDQAAYDAFHAARTDTPKQD